VETIVKTLKFKPIEPMDVNLDLLKEVARMHVEYLKYSKDTTLMVPDLLEAIRAVVTRKVLFDFWLLLDENKLAGYALTELSAGVHGPELHIAQAYIDKPYRDAETQKLTIKGFEKYAKARGCVFLTSCTRREPQKAYERWMGRVGFKKRWVVMEKDLRGE